MAKWLLNYSLIFVLCLAPSTGQTDMLHEIKLATGLELSGSALLKPAASLSSKMGILGLSLHMIMLPIYYLQEAAAPTNRELDKKDQIYNNILWGQAMQDPKLYRNARQTINQAVDLLNKKCEEKKLAANKTQPGLFKRGFKCGVSRSRVYLSRTHYTHQAKYKGTMYWFIPATLLMTKKPIQSIALSLAYLASYHQISYWVKQKYKLNPTNGSDGQGKYFSEYAAMYGATLLDLPESTRVSEHDIDQSWAESIYEQSNLGLDSSELSCLATGHYCYRIIDINYRELSPEQVQIPCGGEELNSLLLDLGHCEQVKLDPYLSGQVLSKLQELQTSVDKAKSIDSTFGNTWYRGVTVATVAFYMLISKKVPVQTIAKTTKLKKVFSWLFRLIKATPRFAVEMYIINEAIVIPIEGVHLLIEGTVQPRQQFIDCLDTLIRQKQETQLSDEEFYKRLEVIFKQNGAESVQWLKAEQR